MKTDSSFFEKNPMPMWIIEPFTFRFLKVNEAAILHYGYSPEEFLSMTALEIRPGEEKEKFLKLDRSAQSEPHRTGIWKHLKKSGEVIHVEVHASDITFNGAHARLVLANDVTEKIYAEEKLRRSENLFRSLIEKSTDMKSLLTAGGKIIYGSPSISEQLGYLPGEYLDKPVFGFIHPEEAPGLAENIQEIMKTPGKSFHSQQRLLHKNGSWRWCEGTVTNQLDEPGIYALVSNFRDITDRKIFENKLEKTTLELLLIKKDLEESEKSLKNALAIAQMGSWEVDFVTFETRWSEESFKILGTTPSETHPSAESFLSFIHPEDHDRVKKILDDSMINFQRFSFEARIIRTDGAVRYIHSDAEYTLDKNKKPVFLQGTMQDVTEKRKLETGLKELNRELKTFIYRSSHDLRGPLASILGLVSILETAGEDELRRHVKTIGDLARKLDDSLLKLVKVMSSREKESNFALVDMEKMLKDLLASLKFVPGYSRIKFNIKNNLAKPFVTDREALHSILQNLIENSIKYQDFRKPEPYININIYRNGSPNVLLEVSDNGLGIPAESKDKIFDMFYRGNDSTKGSGLGLYITKATVEKLGGSIEFSSKIKEATTFKIILPEKSIT